MRVRKVVENKKIKEGRIFEEYSKKEIAKKFGFNPNYYFLYDTPDFFNLLILGAICIFEEYKNKDEFKRICSLIKKDEPEVISFDSVVFPSFVSKYPSINFELYIHRGIEARREGLTYEDLSSVFKAKASKEQHDLKFKRWLEEKYPNLSEEIFFN
jgi:hypothetical protein